MQKLSRYRNAFDMQDKDGNTAYCIALRYNDVSAQEILENMVRIPDIRAWKVLNGKRRKKRAGRNGMQRQNAGDFVRRRVCLQIPAIITCGGGWAPLPSAAELQHWPEAEEAAAAVKYTGRRERMVRFIWEQENPAVR